MPDDHSFIAADERLRAGEGPSDVLHPLNDAVHILKMLPYEATDPLVFRDRLVGAILTFIPSRRPSNRNVVDIWSCNVRMAPTKQFLKTRGSVALYGSIFRM